MENRYDRQERIPGWNQKKLTRARIAVVGAKMLGQYVAASLAGLGIGTIKIFDNTRIETREKENVLILDAKGNDSRAEGLENILSKINPLIRVHGIHWRFAYDSAATILGNEDLVIDATNDSRSKKILAEYCQKTKVPFISVSADKSSGELIVCFRNYEKDRVNAAQFQRFNEKAQSNIPSAVLGGIAAEEARKIVMSLNEKDVPTKDRLVYNNLAPSRTAQENSIELESDSAIAEKKVLMIGAGSLGNIVGIGLMKNGVRHLDTVDSDTVEEINLNRQILFHDAIGEKKATALTRKLREIAPKASLRGYDRRVDESFERDFASGKYDLVIDCVDNFQTRELVNSLCQKYSVPLVSGGTNPHNGQTVVYVPGKTKCLECAIKVSKLAQEAREREAALGCIRVPDPSVIVTNMIVAGLMVGEAYHVLCSGEPVKGNLKYAADQSQRLGLLKDKKSCKCHKKHSKTGRVA